MGGEKTSTYRVIMGVSRCLQALVEQYKGKCDVFQVVAMNLLEVINRGSPKLSLNARAKELFWFCLRDKIII